MNVLCLCDFSTNLNRISRIFHLPFVLSHCWLPSKTRFTKKILRRQLRSVAWEFFTILALNPH